MMKTFRFLCLPSILVLFACQPTSDLNRSATTLALTHEAKNTIEGQLLEEYRQILEQEYTSPLTEKQQLHELLYRFPEHLHSTALMRLKVDVLLRLGELQAAFDQVQIINQLQPNASYKQFECFLMEVLDYSTLSTKACYQQSAQLYQPIIQSEAVRIALQKDHAANTPYAHLMWSYYVSLYRAGQSQYAAELKKFVAQDQSGTDYFQLQMLLETEPEQRSTFLSHFKTQYQPIFQPSGAYQYL